MFESRNPLLVPFRTASSANPSRFFSCVSYTGVDVRKAHLDWALTN